MTVWVALALLGAWMLVLTALVAGLIRHVAEVRLALEAGKPPEVSFDFARSGPQVGSHLPRAVHSLLGPAANGAMRTLTFFTASCGDCLERAHHIAGSGRPLAGHVFFVGAQEDGATAAAIAEVLASAGADVVTGRPALDAMQALAIEAIPWVVKVDGGEVVDSAYLGRRSSLDSWYAPVGSGVAT